MSFILNNFGGLKIRQPFYDAGLCISTDNYTTGCLQTTILQGVYRQLYYRVYKISKPITKYRRLTTAHTSEMMILHGSITRVRLEIFLIDFKISYSPNFSKYSKRREALFLFKHFLKIVKTSFLR